MRMKTKYILSYGGGVNSTALLFYLLEKKMPLDEVIFADTGTEMPETYAYLPLIKKYCKRMKIKFTTVKGRVGVGRKNTKYFSNLRDYCFHATVIPSRKFRFCTEKFKIIPINKHLKKYGCKIVTYIGFDFGEIHRKRPSMIDWIEYAHPFIDAKINRQGCERIIKEMGFPVPVKSGCWFCPFQKLSEWKELRRKHEDLFADAMMLEERVRAVRDDAMFSVITLKQIDKATREQRTIGEFIKEPCEYGWCMT